MTFSSAIDIAIGLMLMYLVLSLVCTVINEYLSQILGLRSKTLAAGIERLIDDPRLRKDFYDHGLVDMTRAASGGKHPSYLSGQTFAMALIGSVDPTKPMPWFDDIKEAVQSLPDSNVRDTLLSHLMAADGDLTRVREGLASTFDAAMDRLSGVYKRNLRWFSLVIGLAVAVALNADTLAVTRALWNDGALRTAIAAQAQRELPGLANAEKQGAGGSAPEIAQYWETLRPLPLGWHAASKQVQQKQSTAQGRSPKQAEGGVTVLGFLSKLLGLILTGLALSLGAPFWFDLLSKFVQLRATGGRPTAGTQERRTGPSGRGAQP